MDAIYDIFDCSKITVDNQISINDLLQMVFYKFGYYKPADVDIVTIFAPAKKHIVVNKNNTCAEENLSSFLCIAY